MRVRPSGGPASTAGPSRFSLESPFSGWLPLAALLLGGLLSGCAGGAAGPAADPAPPDADVDEAAPAADEVREARLDEVALALEGGSFERAARLADSLYFRWRSSPELDAMATEALWREAMALQGAGRASEAAERLSELLERDPGDERRLGAVRELARLHVRQGGDPAATDLLLENPAAIDAAMRDLLRRAAASMSLAELSAATEGLGMEEPGATILFAARAEALALSGEPAAAADLAGRVLAAGPADPEASLADAVRAGEIAPESGPVRIGAILPLTGRFSQVGSWLEEGLRLALQERDEDATPPVELEILDDGSDPDRTRELVARLEGMDVAAVIGPVRSRALAEAGAARGDAGLLVVSPTATEVLQPAPGVYTLWDRERRETDAARVLGRWLGRAVGGRATGALYPASEAGREAYLAFRQGLERGGGYLSAAASYPEDETTFRDPIITVGAYQPASVFVISGSSSSILQMAPQLSYYNVQAPIVAGGPEWAEPEIVRRLDPSVSQRRIVASFVDRTATEGPWADFKASYERTYRKSLSANMLPALAHDAMELVLDALPDRGPVRFRAVTRQFSRGGAHEGATGVLRPDPATGTFARRIEIRLLRERQLVEIDPLEIGSWLERSGAVEGVRLRRRQRTAREEVETRLRQLREPREEVGPQEEPPPEPPESDPSDGGFSSGSGPRS